MYNDKISTTGRVDVIMRSFGDATINGISYKKNEPVLVLKNINAQIIYDENNKTARSKTNVLHSANSIPNKILIFPKSLTQDIYKLIGMDKNSGQETLMPYFEKYLSDAGGQFITNQTIDETSDIFIYDSLKQRVETFTIGSNGFVNNLAIDTVYYISYYSKETNQMQRELQLDTIPYLTIEIIQKGKINNINTTCLIKIPRCSLSVVPNLTLSEGTITGTGLEFTIIKINNDDNVVVTYY